jgi:4-amino-4-deoxy-L-arabinose transferase-like glycosyltransferase
VRSRNGLTGDYSKVQLNFTPFWEKPPLFIWMQALCMNAFGINEFAADYLMQFVE